MSRPRLLAELADRIAGLHPHRRVRVAVDGVDGAGKTTFADELAPLLATRRPVVRAGVDGFHRPAEQRYRRGRDSPVGFFLDSYDYPTLCAELLDPFAPDGDGRYRTEVFDYRRDAVVSAPVRQAAVDAVLLLDGIFLHRDELAGYWDLSVYLHVDFTVSVPRGAARGPGFGSPDPDAPANLRYVQGQRHYLAAARPLDRADLVIDNTELARPVLLRDAAAGRPGQQASRPASSAR